MNGALVMLAGLALGLGSLAAGITLIGMLHGQSPVQTWRNFLP